VSAVVISGFQGHRPASRSLVGDTPANRRGPHRRANPARQDRVMMIGFTELPESADVPTKVISETLGHASAAFTDGVYAAVAEELAEAISAFVLRRGPPAPVLSRSWSQLAAR
jgi:hypothetical protein